MKQYESKDFIPLLQAWTPGKTMQVHLAGGWQDVHDCSFNFPIKHYRIKPEPKLRPWRQEEMPCLLGAWGRNKTNPNNIAIITAVWDGRLKLGVYAVEFGAAPLEDLEYSLDNGKTWLPCGVLESE